MAEYGIWSQGAGGFAETQFWSAGEAETTRAALIADGEDADDLEVLPVCPDHAEQPATGCEECEDQDEEECECCEEYGAAHNNKPCSVCGHTAQDQR
jgi:hypothetical protein